MLSNYVESRLLRVEHFENGFRSVDLFAPDEVGAKLSLT
jgi:hypothetical protein